MPTQSPRPSVILFIGLVCLAWTALLPGSRALANILSGTPGVQLESNQDRAEMGGALAAADFNGDGLDDLVVGVHKHDDGEVDEGGALLFLAPILSSSPFSAAARFQSDQANALLGTSVAAGDVNGDGRPDILLGAPGYGTGGAVFVFFGSAAGFTSGSPATADRVFQSDRPNALFGTSIALGDFNGDGFDDVLIGAPEYTNTQSFETEREGIAVIFHGGPGIASGTPQTAATLLAGGQRAADFGEFVSAGNVNGDGADDALVAATRFDTNPTDAGAAFVFHGSAPGGIPDGTPDTANASILGDQFRGEIGSSLLAADFDGDGFGDLVVGAHLYDNPDSNEGVVLLFPGSASGVSSGGPAAAAVHFEGDSVNHVFGFRLAVADVDDDGFRDLLLAAPSFNGALAPRIYLFLGSAGGFVSGGSGTADAALVTLGTFRPFTGLGSALAVGDYDGDGFPDLAAGAPTDELGTLAIGDEGTVQIYFGGSVAPANSPPLSASDHQDGAYVTDSDTPLTVPLGQQGLLINDFDPEAIGQAAILDTSTSHGVLTFTPGTGAFTYVPDPGFAGFDSFTYHVTDGISDSVPAVVTIQVGSPAPPPPPPPPPPNGAPSAAGDAYSVDEDDVLTVPAPGVLGNDADPDGDPLTTVLGTPPANGTLDLAADGSFTYTPGPDFSGDDSFTYSASDGAATSAAANVTITVDPVPDCPTLDLEISFDVPFNGVLNIPAPGLLQGAVDPRGNPLVPVLLVSPSHGTLVIDPSGAFTYTPFPGFRGRDFFTFAVDNGVDDPECTEAGASPLADGGGGPVAAFAPALSPPATVTLEVGLEELTEVPALGTWGLLSLILALAAASLGLLRR